MFDKTDKINYLIHKTDNRENKQMVNYILESGKYEFADKYSSPSSSYYQYKDSDADKKTNGLFVFIIFVIIAFGTFLLASYIVSCVHETKNQIGILRCVGAPKKDIYLIFLWQSLLMFAVLFTSTLLAFCLVYLPLANLQYAFMPIAVYNLRIRDALILVAVLVAILSATVIFSVRRLVNKTPIQILND